MRGRQWRPGKGYEGIDKLSHEWMNVRHVQHHVGQLSDRLARAGVELPWRGPGPK